MEFIHTNNFADIADEFQKRVDEMVWCSASTVDSAGRPRTRVLHPIWQGNQGWLITSRASYKATHIARKPNMSLAYIKDPMNPAYADCTTAWIDDMDEKKRIWDIFKNTPNPIGYDPEPIFGAVENDIAGILKLTPWRLEVYTIGIKSIIWKP